MSGHNNFSEVFFADFEVQHNNNGGTTKALCPSCSLPVLLSALLVRRGGFDRMLERWLYVPNRQGVLDWLLHPVPLVPFITSLYVSKLCQRFGAERSPAAV